MRAHFGLSFCVLSIINTINPNKNSLLCKTLLKKPSQLLLINWNGSRDAQNLEQHQKIPLTAVLWRWERMYLWHDKSLSGAEIAGSIKHPCCAHLQQEYFSREWEEWCSALNYSTLKLSALQGKQQLWEEKKLIYWLYSLSWEKVCCSERGSTDCLQTEDF